MMRGSKNSAIPNKCQSRVTTEQMLPLTFSNQPLRNLKCIYNLQAPLYGTGLCGAWYGSGGGRGGGGCAVPTELLYCVCWFYFVARCRNAWWRASSWMLVVMPFVRIIGTSDVNMLVFVFKTWHLAGLVPPLWDRGEAIGRTKVTTGAQKTIPWSSGLDFIGF